MATGVFEALCLLREKMPDDKLLVPDAANRAFVHVNGFEIEGFPGRHDPRFLYYSVGNNKLALAREFCRKPSYSHVQHKMRRDLEGMNYGKDDRRGFAEGDKIPPRFNRFVMGIATAQLSAVTWYGTKPARDQGLASGIYDEMRRGVEGTLGWLGRPASPLIYPETSKPPLFSTGLGVATDRLEPTGATLRRGADGQVVVVGRDPQSHVTRLILKDITSKTGNLLVKFDSDAKVRSGCPKDFPRKIEVVCAAESGPMPKSDVVNLTSYIMPDPFTLYFDYRPVPTDKSVQFLLKIEGTEPVTIRDLAVYDGTGAMAREFENGLVLVNASFQDYRFDLARLFPGKTWRRFRGTQDPLTNNGEPVGDSVTLGKLDALFLVRVK
jgi:hypothetical protein